MIIPFFFTGHMVLLGANLQERGKALLNGFLHGTLAGQSEQDYQYLSGLSILPWSPGDGQLFIPNFLEKFLPKELSDIGFESFNRNPTDQF